MSVEKYFKQNLAAMDENLKRDLDDNETLHANQAKVIKENYGLEIDTKNQAYDDDLRANEVQKYINMREVAENNANLGLTDSGLNRTQSTAVQLSASNNAAKIERDRTNMVNSLTAEMNRYLTEIENNRISSEASIRKGYEDSAMDAAVKGYEADVDAAAKKYKADVDAELEKYRIAANVSSERVGEIEDEIEKIKIAAAKGRNDSKGMLINGYDVKTVANDAINDYLNQLVRKGEITKERAMTLYKNLAYRNDIYGATAGDRSVFAPQLSSYLQGYYENGQVKTKKR